MRSPFAYTPRPRPLQAASPGAAVAYLGALVAVAFLYSNPLVLLAAGAAVVIAGLLAGARRAVRAALRMGLALALLIVVVNALVVNRGETVLARLGDWPLLGQVDVTAEAIAAGAVFGLRAVVVDGRLRRLLGLRRPRPGAARPAPARRPLGPHRDPGLPPGPGRRRRRRPAARRGPPARARRRRGRPRPAGPPPARRLARPRRRRRRDPRAARLQPRTAAPPLADLGEARGRSRFDRRFYLAAAAVLAAAIAAKLLGADDFHAYPTIEIGLAPSALSPLSALLVLSGLVRAPQPGRRHV